MGSIYPRELTDLENTLICERHIFDSWLAGECSDKKFAINMSKTFDMTQKDMRSLKDVYRREAKVILELVGEEVPT